MNFILIPCQKTKEPEKRGICSKAQKLPELYTKKHKSNHRFFHIYLNLISLGFCVNKSVEIWVGCKLSIGWKIEG